MPEEVGIILYRATIKKKLRHETEHIFVGATFAL
jgi:hypothetical protein